MPHARHRLTPEKTKPVASTALPVAAWYDDPENGSLLRWWSGTEWTEHRFPHPGVTSQPAASASEPNVQDDRSNPPAPSTTATPVDLRSRIPAQSLMEQLAH